MSLVYEDLLNPQRDWDLMCNTDTERYSRLSAQSRQIASSICLAHIDYRLVAEFTSDPSLSYLGVPLSIPDQWSDEGFTVYDHPHVMILQRVK